MADVLRTLGGASSMSCFQLVRSRDSSSPAAISVAGTGLAAGVSASGEGFFFASVGLVSATGGGFVVAARVSSQLNAHDVTSPHARAAQGITVERLQRHDSENGEWRKVLVEDKKAGGSD